MLDLRLFRLNLELDSTHATNAVRIFNFVFKESGADYCVAKSVCGEITPNFSWLSFSRLTLHSHHGEVVGYRGFAACS